MTAHPGSALWWMDASDEEAAARLAELRAADHEGNALREAMAWVRHEEPPAEPDLGPLFRRVG